MSRAIIGGVVVAIILALTAAAYVVSTSSLSGQIADDLEKRVVRAQRLLIQNEFLDSMRNQQLVEQLAADPNLARALASESPGDRDLAASRAFDAFLTQEAERRPDIIALTDATGDIVAMLDVPNPVPGEWKSGQDIEYRAVELALTRQQITSEVWNYENQGLMKASVAPVVEIDAEGQENVLGAVVIAYSMTALKAQRQEELLGAEVAYFYDARVYGNSFRTRGKGSESGDTQGALTSVLTEEDLARTALESGASKVVNVGVSGETYLVTAGQLPRISTAKLPADHPAKAGAMVMMSLDDARSSLGIVRSMILLLGLGALVLAIIGIVLTSKRILAQADTLEVGINEIINGNLDRSFRPVGAELDGLANALNVMLARLLGRPEPGEEEYDDEGNIIQANAVSFDEEVSPADSQNMALAQEPEPDYYKRIFGEYVEARKQVGEAGDVTYEAFITKLRINEGKLKQQYQCDAVRFKVVVKDRKVSLKPVPIHRA